MTTPPPKRQISTRLSAEELARLAALAPRLPDFDRSTLVRAALRLGLDAIERDPAILLRPAPKRRPAK